MCKGTSRVFRADKDVGGGRCDYFVTGEHIYVGQVCEIMAEPEFKGSQSDGKSHAIKKRICYCSCKKKNLFFSAYKSCIFTNCYVFF